MSIALCQLAVSSVSSIRLTVLGARLVIIPSIATRKTLGSDAMRYLTLQQHETTSAADERNGYGELSERDVYGYTSGNSLRPSLFSDNLQACQLRSLNDSAECHDHPFGCPVQ
jgi:hypothetical protein